MSVCPLQHPCLAHLALGKFTQTAWEEGEVEAGYLLAGSPSTISTYGCMEIMDGHGGILGSDHGHSGREEGSQPLPLP